MPTTSGTLVLQVTPVLTGGALNIYTQKTGSAGQYGVTLSRSSDGGTTWTQLYSGQIIQFYLDVGDMTLSPLLSNTGYQYQITDSVNSSITYTSPVVYPISTLQVLQDVTTETIMRMVEAGLSVLQMPGNSNWQPPKFLYQMPLDNTPQLPFVTTNLDLIQQEEIPIGFTNMMEDINQESQQSIPGTGVFSMTGLQNRRYSFYVFSKMYRERDFIQESIIAIIMGIQASLSHGNEDIRFSYQAAQGAVEFRDAEHPGFYYAQITADITRQVAIKFTSTVGRISTIDITTSPFPVVEVQ